ncbi:MAG TPA: response regulator transcription factor [Mycobacteriales bacterium]|nr:response regulator transcription factor [Mycobacteriales bacterium]
MTATAIPPIRVFLMDDHDLIRRGLRDLLEAEPDITVVGEAGRATDAIRDISALRPDVAILDLRVPDGTGVEVCRQVRTAEPDVACLILTSFDDRHALLAAIAAGASGFVLKEIRSTDLITGVRTAAAGESLLNPAITEQILSGLQSGASAPPGPERLNPDELSVLRLVAEGLSDRQIGEQLFLPERTIRLHFARLLVKLGLQAETASTR